MRTRTLVVTASAVCAAAATVDAGMLRMPMAPQHGALVERSPGEYEGTLRGVGHRPGRRTLGVVVDDAVGA